MIIVQTPLRISLFGGGTDFPSYYLSEGGCVLTTAINKYIFVIIKQRFDEKIRVGYTRTEIVDRVEELQHELIREALIKTGIPCGVEITTMGDIPAGTGLGSSATVTVGSLHAMYEYMHEGVTSDRLAEEADEIERQILKRPIGVQDQYIVAFGGMRFMEFTTDGQIHSERISLNGNLARNLNENLMMFYTGSTRMSNTILLEQQNKIGQTTPVLRKLKDMAVLARDELVKGNLDSLGYLLHESWQLKKQLASGVSNGSIDALYTRAREAGALGGKISGAGGGGFMLLYCPPARREEVRSVFTDMQELPFELEPNGSCVIFNHRQ